MNKQTMITRLRDLAKITPSYIDRTALREACNVIEVVDVSRKTFEKLFDETFPATKHITKFHIDAQGNYKDLRLYIAYTMFKVSREKQLEPLNWLPDLEVIK